MSELLHEVDVLINKEFTVPQSLDDDPEGSDNHKDDRKVASFIQGMDARNLKGIVNALEGRFGGSRDWKGVLEKGEIGSVANYGMDDKERTASGASVDGKDVGKVWESDLMLIDSEEAGRLGKVKRKLGSLKGRVDLCGKIVCALEGKDGRRYRRNFVGGWKVKLQKMEQTAKDLEAREAKARENARKKELRKKELADKVAEKAENEKKRKESEEKQIKKNKSTKKSAMFMAKFVKSKSVTAQERASPSCISSVINLDGAGSAEDYVALKKPLYASDTAAGLILNRMKFFDVSEIDKRLQWNRNLDRDEDLSNVHLGCLILRSKKLREAALASLSHKKLIINRADYRGRSPEGLVIKVLQFHDNNRPAYVGTWTNSKSRLVHGRRPFGRDPSLNYQYDSDAEWEEDDPGESLSDIDDEEEDDVGDMFDSEVEDDDFLVKDDDDDGIDGRSESSSQHEKQGPRAAASESSAHDSLALSKSKDRETIIDLEDPNNGMNRAESEQNSSAGGKRGISLVEIARAGSKKKKAKIICRKRRRHHPQELVVSVTGVVWDDGTPNPILDQFPVVKGSSDTVISMHQGSEIGQEKLAGNGPTVTLGNGRAGLDVDGVVELARFLHGNKFTREQIIEEFAEMRRSIGKPVYKNEIGRRISEMAERERSGPPAQRSWILKDAQLIEKVTPQTSDASFRSNMGSSPITPQGKTPKAMKRTGLAKAPRKALFDTDNSGSEACSPKKPVPCSPIKVEQPSATPATHATVVPLITID